MVCSASSSRPVDVWALGCTITFMASGKPLLIGSTVRGQIEEVIMKVGKYSSTLYHCHHVLLQPSLVSLKHYQHRQLAYICNVCNVGSGSECSTQFILQSGLACRAVFFASAIHFVCQGSPAPSRSSVQYPGRPSRSPVLSCSMVFVLPLSTGCSLTLHLQPAIPSFSFNLQDQNEHLPSANGGST